MRKTVLIGVVAGTLAAFGAGTEVSDPSRVTEAISFHGFVENGSGSQEGRLVTFDFKLYSSEAADAELLWARRVPVSLDKEGGFYVDLTDSSGQPYQATDGRTPSCRTLSEAMARHGQLTPGPVWIAYEPVDAKVSTPPPREGLYNQPVALRAARAKHVDVAEVDSLSAKSVSATATVVADRLVHRGGVMAFDDLRLVAPKRRVELNPSGSVRLGSLAGFRSVTASDDRGTMSQRLPATADADSGRVIRRELAPGKPTHETIFYSEGDSTTAPSGSTTLYIWTFGKLEEN